MEENAAVSPPSRTFMKSVWAVEGVVRGRSWMYPLCVPFEEPSTKFPRSIRVYVFRTREVGVSIRT